MKKIPLLALTLMLMLTSCGSVDTRPHETVLNNIDNITEYGNNDRIAYRLTREDSNSDIIYSLNSSEDNVCKKIRLVLYSVVSTRKKIDSGWVQVENYALNYNSNSVLAIKSGVSGSKFIDLSGENSKILLEFMFNDDVIQYREQAKLHDVISYKHIFCPGQLDVKYGEETLLGYIVCSVNRNLINYFDKKYFSQQNTLPDSEYPYQIFAVTLVIE